MNKKIEDIAYLDILKKSWDITWNNRLLWWFGLFLALSGGGNFNFGSGEQKKEQGQKIMEFFSAHLGAVITIAVLVFIILLVLMILGIIARAGAIRSIEKIIKNQPFSFRSGMREGKKYFWKIFSLYIVLMLLMMAALLVLAAPVIILFAAKSYILGAILAILAVLIFIPLAILTSYIKTFGEIYIASGELSSWDAIETSYELFRKNIWPSIIMGLLFISLGIVMMMGMLAVVFPLILLLAFLFFLGPVGIAVAVVLGAALLLAVIFVQSVFQIFHQTAWLLFFHEIATPPVEEKITETAEETEKEIIPAPGEAVKMAENDK